MVNYHIRGWCTGNPIHSFKGTFVFNLIYKFSNNFTHCKYMLLPPDDPDCTASLKRT